MRYIFFVFLVLFLSSCMTASHTIGYEYKIPLHFDYPLYKDVEKKYYSNIKDPIERHNAAKCTLKIMKYNKKISICDSIYKSLKEKCFTRTGLDDYDRAAYCIYAFNFSMNIYNSDNTSLRASKVVKELIYIDIFKMHKESQISGRNWITVAINKQGFRE